MSTSKYDKCVEIKSSNNKKLLPSKSFVLKRCKKTDIFGHDIHVNYSGLKKEIPLVILLKSLGISNDKEVMDYVLNGVDPNSQLGFMYSKFMESSITNYSEYNHVSAIEFMTKFVNIPFKRNSENNGRPIANNRKPITNGTPAQNQSQPRKSKKLKMKY